MNEELTTIRTILKENDGVLIADETFKNKVEDYLDEVIKLLEHELVDNAILHLKRNIKTESQFEIEDVFNKHGSTWWIPFDQGFGVNVRNLLRETVCDDGELPNGYGWEEFWVQLVEASISLRKIYDE